MLATLHCRKEAQHIISKAIQTYGLTPHGHHRWMVKCNCSIYKPPHHAYQILKCLLVLILKQTVCHNHIFMVLKAQMLLVSEMQTIAFRFHLWSMVSQWVTIMVPHSLLQGIRLCRNTLAKFLQLVVVASPQLTLLKELLHILHPHSLGSNTSPSLHPQLIHLVVIYHLQMHQVQN